MLKQRRSLSHIVLGVLVFSIFSFSLFSVQAATTGAVQLKDVKPADAISTWNASSANGWWPNISPDGKYIAYGNWGDSFITDLESKKTWNFKNPPDLTAAHECIGGGWIKPNTVSFVCQFGKGTTFYRYEVVVGEWVPKRMPDNPVLVASNAAAVKDGHWVSIATGRDMVIDNELIEDSAGGGSPTIDGDTVVTACADNNDICIWKDNALSDELAAETPVRTLDSNDNYIAYTGYDSTVYGRDPSGATKNLSALSPANEFSVRLVSANGKMWVATSTCGNNSTDNCSALIRPWGEKNSIVASAKAPYSLGSIVYTNNNFVIAWSGDHGQLVVQTISADSPRYDLCGTKCTDTGDDTPFAPANPKDFPPQTQPPIPNQGLPTDLGQLIEAIFNWSLGLVGLVIFLQFFRAGFMWFTAGGNPGPIGKAKDMMKNAAYGTVILFSAYLILNTINPDLVKSTFTLPGLPGGTSTTTTTGTGPEAPIPPEPANKPASLTADLQAERSKYNSQQVECPPASSKAGQKLCITAEMSGKILNAVALKNKDLGWGMLRKTAGNHCPSPSGDISCDILYYKPLNLIYDVLGDTGGSDGPGLGVPAWSYKGTQDLKNWVAPQ